MVKFIVTSSSTRSSLHIYIITSSYVRYNTHVPRYIYYTCIYLLIYLIMLNLDYMHLRMHTYLLDVLQGQIDPPPPTPLHVLYMMRNFFYFFLRLFKGTPSYTTNLYNHRSLLCTHSCISLYLPLVKYNDKLVCSFLLNSGPQ